MLRVKNWSRFQHYRDRSPPWIKLATDTFQNYDFSRLSDASKLLAICIWTLASRSKDGTVPDDLDYIKGVGRLGSLIKADHLKELIKQGFVEVCSEVLADCEQDACLEGEGEAERETEAEAEGFSPRPPERSSGTPIAEFAFQCDGKIATWWLSREQVVEWEGIYPSLDVTCECRKALAWTRANPAKRKTANGMPAFLVNWLNRAQNGHGRSAGPASSARRTVPLKANEQAEVDRWKRIDAGTESLEAK